MKIRVFIEHDFSEYTDLNVQMRSEKEYCMWAAVSAAALAAVWIVSAPCLIVSAPCLIHTRTPNNFLVANAVTFLSIPEES